MIPTTPATQTGQYGQHGQHGQQMAAGFACSTCGAAVPPGTDRCPRCGALHGEHRRCYACGAKAEVIRKDGGVFVCAACGRPRVPLERPGPSVAWRSGREMEPLARVAAARRDVAIGTALGVVALLAELPVLFFWAIFALTGLGVLPYLTFALAVVIAVAAYAAFFVVRRRAQLRAADAMREAFAAVAVDLMRASGPLTARALGEQLGVPEALAEDVLAALPAREDLRVEAVVDERADDGLLRYRIADETVPAAVDEHGDADQASFDARLQAAMRAKERG